jgi:ABC-type nitrate/sulfonate/bicarbonate transport system permease component
VTAAIVRRSVARTWALRGIRLLSVFAFLALWQWYGNLPNTFAVAPPTEVAEALWEGFTDGDFLTALRGTLTTFFVGYVIAAVLGVLLGFLIATTSWGRNTLEPLTDALYATPMSLLIPVIGIYTGLGFSGRIVFVVFWSIFEIIVNTAAGVRSTPPDRIELARSFSARRMFIYRRVVIPSALPLIATGLRLAVGRALRGAVTAELLLAAANLGRLSLFAQSTFDIPTLLAVIVLVMIVGLALMKLASLAEQRVLRYQEVG